MKRTTTLKRLLSTTAALSVVLASMTPMPVAAQDAAPTEAAPTTPVPPEQPPAQPEAPSATTEESEAATPPAETAPAPEQTPQAAPETPAAPEEVPEATAPDAPPATDEPAAPEAPAAQDAAPAGDTAPAAEPADADADSPADDAAPAETAVEPPSEAAPEADAATSDATDEAPADDGDAAPEAGTAPTGDAATPEARSSDDAPAADDTTAPEADTAPTEGAATPEARPTTDAPADGDTAAPETGSESNASSTSDAEEQATGGETAAPSDPLETLGSALGAAATGAAAAAAAAEGETADGGTVTEITDADARSSEEDFDTSASGEQQAREDDDDGGLSRLEKVGLLALGGLAVGSLLNNGNEVVANTGDRVVLRQENGEYQVLKDDDALLRQPGATVRTENYADGSTLTTVDQADGTRVVTIRDASGRVLRRSHIDTNGNETLLIDDTQETAPVDVSTLPQPREDLRVSASDPGSLRDALAQIEARDNARRFSLAQIRDYREVRALAPVVDVENITFRTGSAAIEPSQAEQLADLGNLMRDMIDDRPGEIFLIEGHTDATGSAVSNLALSDRRAESVALALTEYFDVPPENMIVQGYGESNLRIDTEADEARNRRVAVRIITPILQVAQNR